MADTLPHTDAALVAQCQRDYESAASMGGQQALDACFRLSWALVHSPAPANIKRGLDLAEALLDGLPEGGGGGGVGGSEGDAEGPPPLDSRDLRYLLAVGKYRQRRYIEARRVLKALLEERPDFRQAETLLEACDREVLKDGLVGVGAGVALLGAVAAIAVAAMRK